MDELGERGMLSSEELAFIFGNADAGKLGLACQLAFWRWQGRIPDEEADLAPAVIAHLASQLGLLSEDIEGYAFVGRSGRRHRQLVLDHLAVGAFDDAAEAAFRSWLLSDMLPREPAPSSLEDEITGWFAARRVVRPGMYRLDRLIRSVRPGHDDAVLATVVDRLDDEARSRLDGLLADDGEGAAYTRLFAAPGKPGLDSLWAEIAKLQLVRGLQLPTGLLSGVHPDLVKRFRRRASVESAWELRRHPGRIRLPLLGFYCVPREADIVDGLVDLLIQITHRITVKAERRVVTELLEEAKAVRGKAGILFKVATAFTGAPDGLVRDVIFPVVDERTFEVLVKEALAAGSAPSRRVHKAVRASYGSYCRRVLYYRRMLPKHLAALDFQANNSAHKPLTDALAMLDRGMQRNNKVKLNPRRRHPIVVTPLDPAPAPPTREALGGELGRRWPMTGLLDILKEADLRIGFTDAFSTAASREATDPEAVRRRVLLCLYGLGTNAGLKRLVGDHGFTYKELLHTRRRYVDVDSLRNATRRVVNATLAARDPAVGARARPRARRIASTSPPSTRT